MLNVQKKYEWTVIGAGPAGIAAIGKLLDHQINPKNILWLDPFFNVGDFAAKWSLVPSNTKVNLFTKFLLACKSFEYENKKAQFELNSLNPEDTCKLGFMAEPLKLVTTILRNKVESKVTQVTSLKMHQRHWQVNLNHEEYFLSKNVILAVGAEEKILSYPHMNTISLETAFNPTQLSTVCSPEDTVAIFGSSHSAILIIRNLIESCSVKKIINFYQTPLCYAVDLGDMILFDSTGLKGSTAQWARENLHGNLPNNLERVLTTSERYQEILSQCNQAIYAIGFQKRSIPIEGFDTLSHNQSNGIIAPGLFGFGIAYPEAKIDKYGNLEHRVGLWKFMDYLSYILPLWLKYPA